MGPRHLTPALVALTLVGCVPPSTIGYRSHGALGDPGQTQLGPSGAIGTPGGGVSLFLDGEHTFSNSLGMGFSGGLLAMNPQAQVDLRLSTNRDAPLGLTGVAGMSTIYFGNFWAGPYAGLVARAGKPGVGFAYLGPKVNPVLGYGISTTWLDLSAGYGSDYRDARLNWGLEATTLSGAKQPADVGFVFLQGFLRVDTGAKR